MMSPKAGLIGLIPALTAILFLAVAIGVDKWQYKNEQVSKYVEFQGHGGLWKFCNDTTRTYSQSIGMNVVKVKETLISVCYDFNDICSQRMAYYLRVVQYALFASIAFMFLGILLILVKHCLLKEWKHEKQQMVLGFISATFAFLTGILAVLAFGIFHVELVLEGYSLHAGFYLTVIAWLLSWVTGSIFLVDSICIGAKMYPDLK